MTAPRPLSAEYFDGWYADMTEATATPKDAIARRHLGIPAHLLGTSLLPWESLGVVVDALRLAPGGTLLDLACGRGSYGLEVSALTGVGLVGVDFSAEAVRQASDQAARLGRQATFLVGDLTASGLDDASVDAVICLDSIQFAEPPAAAYAELRRVLVPGGRVVLTCWDAVDRSEERVPARLRSVDLGSGLRGAGFVDVEIVDSPDWRDVELAVWRDAVALDPGDDPALRSFHDEGVRSLEMADAVRRVLASATAPPSVPAH